MNYHIYVEQNNVPELTNAQFLDGLKNIVDNEYLDNESDLKGILQSHHIYNDTFDFFSENYPRLSIVCTNGKYIRFKDQTLFNILSQDNNIGDGTGITIEDANNVNTWPTWGNNAEQTFESFDELKYFTKLTTIPQGKFYNLTTLKNIDLSNVTTINGSAFQNTSLIYVDAHNATTIQFNAFTNCKSLIEVDISSFIPSGICQNIFSNDSNLKKIIVSPNLTIIPAGFVDACNNLEEIENLNYSNITEILGGAFSFADKLFLNIPTFSNEHLTVLHGRTFVFNKSIQNVNFPNVTSLLNDNVWGGIFHGCTNLKSVVLSTQCTDIPSLCFTDSTLETFDFSHIESIGSTAFRSTKIQQVNAPNLLTIEGYAFHNCTNLTAVNIPSVTTLNEGVFRRCTSLTSINLSSSIATIGSFAFDDCRSLVINDLNLPNAVSINEAAFRNTKIKKISNLGNCVLGPYVFANCKELTEITNNALSHITILNEKVFSGCTSLTSIGNTPNLITINSEALWDSPINYLNLSSVENINANAIGRNLSYIEFTLTNKGCIDLQNVKIIDSYGFGTITSTNSDYIDLGTHLTTVGTEVFMHFNVNIIIRSTTLPTFLNGYSHLKPATGYYVYVPEIIIDGYKTECSTYADSFKTIENDLPAQYR